MKKKFVSVVMLITLLAAQVMSVSAASKTAQMVPTAESAAWYEAQDMPESMIQEVATQSPESADLIQEINAGTKVLQDLEAVAPNIAAQLEGMTLITPIEDVIPINGGRPLADGRHPVTLSVPTLAPGMTDIKVLHYSTKREVWEIITPESVDIENKQLDVIFEDLSPVGIIAKVDASQAVNNVSGTSPKTGVETDNTWAGFGVAAIAFIGAAVVVLRRKRA